MLKKEPLDNYRQLHKDIGGGFNIDDYEYAGYPDVYSRKLGAPRKEATIRNQDAER